MLDVAVVGGGPGGLSAAHAILRARPNANVAVFERSDVRPRGATFGLVPNGVRALEAINPELRASLERHHSAPSKTRRFGMDGELVFSSDEGGMSGRAKNIGPMLSLPWHSLQRELAEALPERVLHTGHRFLRYSEHEGGVTGDKRVEARLLVGCDGGQSLVREQLLGDGPPTYLGTAIWRAVRPMPDDWVVDEGWASWGRPGQASLLATTLRDGMLAWQAFHPWPAEQLHVIGGARRAYIANDTQRVDAGDATAAQRLARATKAFQAFPDPIPSLLATTDPAAVTEHGQFCREAAQCQTYARGRVALTGDAAHLFTPMLGQGASQAIEDALALGRAVGQHGPTPAALAEYQRFRQPLASAVQAASVQLFKDFAAGTAQTTEMDVNLQEGFLTRTFEPLRPSP